MITVHEPSTYTIRLAAGLGMIEETHMLLDLWCNGMTTAELHRRSLDSGHFSGVSASRLKNMIFDGFAPRYLVNNGTPARILKDVRSLLSNKVLEQLMFLYTCRAYPILADFVRTVYWPTYASGRGTIANDDAWQFVSSANQQGKTTTPWTEGTIRRAAGYLTGCCADFGLLEQGRRTVRRILPYHLEQQIIVLIAYDLHLAGLGDNQIIAHEDWHLFGLEPTDVLSELKRMALKGFIIVQNAGSATRIHWPFATLHEVFDGIA